MNSNKLRTILTYPIKKYASCMFAITNRCNAQCGFCSIPKQPRRGVISLTEAVLAINQLYKLGIRYIQFTGGEPLLYPHLIQTIKHASDLGMLTTVVTNSSNLNAKKARALAASGVQEVAISVDHPDQNILEKNRGIPGLGKKIQKGAQYLSENGLTIQASTTISNLLNIEKGDYIRLVEQNQQIGFDGTYFCFPVEVAKSNYALGGKIVQFNKQELARIIEHIKDLKQRGYQIDNTYETLNAALAFLGNKKSNHPCVAGFKVFYLDWNLFFYDCMTKGNFLGPILKLDATKVEFQRIECEACMLSCDREPSIYHHGVRSIVPFFRLVGQVITRGVKI